VQQREAVEDAGHLHQPVSLCCKQASAVLQPAHHDWSVLPRALQVVTAVVPD